MDVKKNTKKKQNKKINAVLHSLFYDVSKPSAYTGRASVYRAARRLLPSITKNDVDRWFEGQLTYTLHRPTRVHFTRNKTIVKSIDEQWQADLCDMQSKAKYNDGKTFILTCIDCFSKYAWAESLENKTADEIIKALERILASGRKPKRFQSDSGTEFKKKKYNLFFVNTTFNFSQQTVNRRRV